MSLSNFIWDINASHAPFISVKDIKKSIKKIVKEIKGLTNKDLDIELSDYRNVVKVEDAILKIIKKELGNRLI